SAAAGRYPLTAVKPVIASEAKQSSAASEARGLPRRFAPRNDGSGEGDHSLEAATSRHGRSSPGSSRSAKVSCHSPTSHQRPHFHPTFSYRPALRKPKRSCRRTLPSLGREIAAKAWVKPW